MPTAQILLKLSHDLNEGLDHLTEKIVELEKVLIVRGFGVTAEVPLEIPGDRRRGLVFGKHDNRWAFFLIDYDAQGEEERRTLLTGASKRLRVESAARMEALLVALREEAIRQTYQVNQAVAKLDSVLALFASEEGT